jgi:hypothetical protein
MGSGLRFGRHHARMRCLSLCLTLKVEQQFWHRNWERHVASLGDKRCVQGNLLGRDYLEDIGVDGWTDHQRSGMGRNELDCSGPG